MAESIADGATDDRITILHALSDHMGATCERILAANTHTGAAALFHRHVNPSNDADHDDALVRKRADNHDDALVRKRAANHADILAREWTANANRAGKDDADQDTARHGQRPIVQTGLMFLFRENSARI